MLITGASTLLAGLRGAGLKEQFDSGRDKRVRRIEAYSDLALSLDELNCILREPSTLKPEVLAGTVGEAVGRAVDAVQRSYFAVHLVESDAVQPLAEKAWQAACDLHQWISHESLRTPDKNLGTLFDELRQAGEAFVDAVRAGIAR